MGKVTQANGDLILHAMLAMATADGHIDGRERAAIAGIYEDVTGRTIGEADVERAVEARAAQCASLNAELAAAAKGLDRETKEHIVRAAYLVLLADEAITAQERKRLRDMADALRIPEVHFCAVMEDVAVRRARQGR